MLKALAEGVLASSVARLATRGRRRGRALILAYHGVTPDGEPPAGERALFVSERDFARQLDMLADVADVVPLNQLDDPPSERARVAITFDDAYHGAVSVGVRELVRRQLPATIFAAPGRLDRHVFWWDALADASGVLDATTRHRALHECGGDDERVRAWAASASFPTSDALPVYARSATRAELRAAVANVGITVASHTWSHANLTSLTEQSFAAELARPLEWLRTEFAASAMPWLAYPYGLETTAVRHAVSEAGYSSAVLVEGGWHTAGDVSRFARPRLNVPGGVSARGFRARLFGARRA